MFEWTVVIKHPDDPVPRAVINGIEAHNWRHALLDAVAQSDVPPPDYLSAEFCEALTLSCPVTGLTYRILRRQTQVVSQARRELLPEAVE